MTKIAEQEVLFVPPSAESNLQAEQRGVKVVLGIAIPVGDIPATCVVYAEGIWPAQTISGADRWQALFLASGTCTGD